MNEVNSKTARIFDLLKKRHMFYLGIPEGEIMKDPFWHSIKPISKRDYSEWLEYGVSTIITERGFSRTEAEKEMSWIESQYMIKISD